MLNNLISVKTKRNKKRVGRGNSSGRGTYSTRGVKGQKARSGGSIKPGFEGGRTPLIRLIPKQRGKHLFKRDKLNTKAVSLSSLDKNYKENEIVSLDSLRQKGLIHKFKDTAKILATGKLDKKLTIKGLPVSEAAKKIIESKGGQIIEESSEQTK